MQPRPGVIVFDVNETLSDMTPMAGRFTEVGAPGLFATVWFTALLRDGFALAASGGREHSPGSPAVRWRRCWPEPA